MSFFKYFQSAIIISIVLVSGLLKAESNVIPAISPVEAEQLFNKKKAVIIDVREDSEWKEQHIPGAIHIPLGQLPERLTELKQYKDSPVIAQCRSGRRSAQASDVLKSAGFSYVYNMEGGLNAWDKAGLKTE
jgi:rhodanese-related sulfurtransferase